MSDLYERIAQLPPEKRALIEAQLFQGSPLTSQSSKIPKRENFSPCPLSFAQQRLWFLDQLNPGSIGYNIPYAARLTGVLHLSALEQSLKEIVHRHEILRTRFSILDGQPVQIIESSPDVSLHVIDLQDIAEPEQLFDVERWVSEESTHSFDLSRGPLFRATVLKLGNTAHVLILVMHHIISDGWSLDIFFRELAVLYNAFSSGNSSPFSPLAIQYADFALWQRERLQGEVLEEQLQYWKQQLGDNPPVLELATDRPRPPVQTFQGDSQSFSLSREVTEVLHTVSQREGTTLFITLLATFNTLLYRYTRQEDLVIGSPIANRNIMDIEPLIGFFVNTLVFRTDLSGNPTFRELLRRVKDVCIGAYSHQDLPFEKLVEELQPERSQAHSPLFQIMFVLQNTPRFLGRIDHQVKIRGFRIELGEIETVLAQHPQVQEAVVLAREAAPHGKHLVAYVVSSPPSVPTNRDLRQFLKHQFPEHMIPSFFVVLETFPLTPNGKIDRRALPAPDKSQIEQEEMFVLPETHIENELAQLWCEILQLDRISIHDNFFMLGGHSLLATQLIARIRDVFQLDVPLRSLFEAPTIAEFEIMMIQIQSDRVDPEEMELLLAEFG